MRLFFSKLYTLSHYVIRGLSLIFTGLLLLGGLLCTCYCVDMTSQKVLTRWDNPLMSFLGIGLFFLLFTLLQRFVCQNPGRRLPILLAGVMIWCAFWGLLLILFSKTVPAADAWSVYSIAEALARGDTSVIHPTDSYLSYYPQQVGLTAFFELLIRIWYLFPVDLQAYHFIKCVYVVLALVIILFQYRTVRLLWKQPEVHCAYLLLMGCNLPFIMYTSFVYGEIPSFAALSAGIYYLMKFLRSPSPALGGHPSRSSLGSGALSLVLFSLSVSLRKNSLIVIIAVVLVAVFQWMKERKSLFLLYALLCTLLSALILPVTQSFYEHRAHNTLSSGVTAMSYFAMGMQEASRGPGWYNGFNFDTYQASGMDTETANAISREAISQRLEYFASHPDYAFDFYLHKYLTQWMDGTYASRQATLATFGGRREVFDSLYTGTLGSWYIEYGNLYQNMLYLGAFLFCLLHGFLHRKRQDDSPEGLPLYLGLIAVFGGFLFHIIWEANSRYIFLYSLLLIPYAAWGLGRLPDLMRRPGSGAAHRPPKSSLRLLLRTLSLAVVCLCLILIFGYLRTAHYHSDQSRKEDILALQSQDYNGLLLSMYAPERFDPKDFAYFRGIPTLRAEHRFETLTDMGDYLRTALDSGQEITSVYLGLDPTIIGEQYGFHASLYHREYKKQLLDLISANPQISFEILLPYYSLDYWQGLSGDRQEAYLTCYQNFVNIFAGQPNLTIYFLGYEEWLIANPGNYDAYNSCNPSVTSNLLALTFKDTYYELTPANMEERLTALKSLIAGDSSGFADLSAPPALYDFSEYEFVFFGDSVIGNFTDSLSVPGVVEGCGNARTYNLAQGGTSAAMAEDPSSQSLNTIVDAFLQKDPSALAPDSQPFLGLTEYAADHDSDSRTRLCFVINYGLNDYFLGYPVTSKDPQDVYTYKGSIFTAVNKLKTAYPDSTILLLSPNFCSYHGNGTTPQSDRGGILTDYVTAVEELSEELQTGYVDSYHDLGIHARNYAAYLSDGCHPNELGRFRMGQLILKTFDDLIAE